MASVHRSATLECFVQNDGKVLMLQRAAAKRIMPNVWMAPGGHIEPGEGLLEAARREVVEETSLRIANLKIKAIGTVILQDLEQELLVFLMTADYREGELPKCTDEGEFAWLTPGEVSTLPNLLSELRHLVDTILDPSANVTFYKATYTSGNTMTEFQIEDGAGF